MIRWLRREIGRRILALALLAMVCATAGTVSVAATTFTRVVNDLSEDHVLDQYRDFIAVIEERQNLALTAAMAIAGRPDVQEAFANRDRQLLLSLSQPSYEALDAEFGVSQFHYHIAPAISFLRLHSPTSFGDDLSYRSMVVDAIADQAMFEGIEIGWAGFGIRGIVPVWRGSEFVGTLEIGFDLGEDLLDTFVENRDLGVSVYLITDPSFPEMAGSQRVAEDLWLYATTMPGSSAHVHLDLVDRVREAREPVIARSAEYGTPYVVLTGPLLDYSGDTVGFVQIHQDLSPVADRLWSSFLQLLLLLMVVLAGVGGGAYLIVRRISSPLVAMSWAAHKAADGDLTQRIDVTGDDEIAVLATALNEMTDSLKHLLHRVSDASRHLSGSSVELAATMEQMDDGIEWMSMALAEMSVGAGAQAERAGDAVRAVTHFVETTDQIASNSQETHQASGLASRLVKEQTEVVEVLVQKLSQIERVVTVIEKIARRTNLLALNASIEASRAGEYGVGFAVVADEVRRLAAESRRFASEIAAISREIGGQMEPVLDKLHETHIAVDQTMSLALETAASTREQAALAQDMMKAMHAVAAVAEQNAVGTEEVAGTITEHATAISEIADSAQALAGMAGELEQLVSGFHLD